MGTCTPGGSHDDAKGGRILARGGGVLEGLCAKLAAKEEVEFVGGGVAWFLGGQGVHTKVAPW